MKNYPFRAGWMLLPILLAADFAGGSLAPSSNDFSPFEQTLPIPDARGPVQTVDSSTVVISGTGDVRIFGDTRVAPVMISIDKVLLLTVEQRMMAQVNRGNRLVEFQTPSQVDANGKYSLFDLLGLLRRARVSPANIRMLLIELRLSGKIQATLVDVTTGRVYR